jgi:hypothetical protein
MSTRAGFIGLGHMLRHYEDLAGAPLRFGVPDGG